MSHYLEPNQIIEGDCRALLPQIEPEHVALSVWSPPYHVGKEYEADQTYSDWAELLSTVIALHFPILKPGGFLAINIADILCFKDPQMPKIMAENVSRRRSSVTREAILAVQAKHPEWNRYQIAQHLGCSEQTVDRRLNGNNIRGGKYDTQTRVKVVGGLIEQWGSEAGFYLYDRRIWVKDPAWQNSKWTSISYRAVDEFEYIYIFWKPGITRVDRHRLSAREWNEWGSRAVWNIPSVRTNDTHEAMFPLELPRRLIRLLSDPNDLVLDCFVGSGTSAVAAIQEGRRYLGIDRDPAYVALARKQCERALPTVQSLTSLPPSSPQRALQLRILERGAEQQKAPSPTQLPKAQG